jgi:uncharacterized protein DUF6152
MNSRSKAGLFLLAVSCFAVLPLSAHHGNAEYENKVITLKGTVTAWKWINPHVLLKVDVKDDKGNVVNWTAEFVAPSNMINFGFTSETFKPGDEITMVSSNVAKTGAPVGRFSEIILANGQVMRTAGKYDGNAAAAADHKANATK